MPREKKEEIYTFTLVYSDPVAGIYVHKLTSSTDPTYMTTVVTNKPLDDSGSWSVIPN